MEPTDLNQEIDRWIERVHIHKEREREIKAQLDKVHSDRLVAENVIKSLQAIRDSAPNPIEPSHKPEVPERRSMVTKNKRNEQCRKIFSIMEGENPMRCRDIAALVDMDYITTNTRLNFLHRNGLVKRSHHPHSLSNKRGGVTFWEVDGPERESLDHVLEASWS